ncbi:unnamed protein product [Bursaphelenchus okinawaensis]|uniref:Uncharacterized protein n=1 Tax=Bursaphelenchus okinawaensis TaxID=465554 RepID=A0A811K860_9BILA|nr:unnamed protein product [Bursaphelenchus okinawaensis]CAG9093715.1 unnamed protein product [Bursaphelenchus okinawaensis]
MTILLKKRFFMVEVGDFMPFLSGSKGIITGSSPQPIPQLPAETAIKGARRRIGQFHFRDGKFRNKRQTCHST